jgi:hypothetical protein
MLQVEATPICGLEKSFSRKPIGYNIARLGARLSPSRTIDEKGRKPFFAETLILMDGPTLDK